VYLINLQIFSACHDCAVLALSRDDKAAYVASRFVYLLGSNFLRFDWPGTATLERQLRVFFRHVTNPLFETIVTLWQSGSSVELLSYFDELLIDKRCERQGFPIEVGKDVFFLSSMYSKYLRQCSRTAMTLMERARREIEDELHREFNKGEFYKAIERREIKVVALYITAGMDLEAAGEGGMTPLLWATFNGAEEVAECLLDNGASCSVRDRNGNTALHWAAFNGLVELSRKLLGKISVDTKALSGWTPLFNAIARGHEDVVKLLLDRGANVNSADAANTSPLLRAISNKQTAIANMLIERGANPPQMPRSSDRSTDVSSHSNHAITTSRYVCCSA